MDLLGNDISIDDVKSVPDDCEFALEAILAEFSEDGTPAFCPPPEQPEEPSRPIVMDEDEGVFAAEIVSDAEPVFEPAPAPEIQELEDSGAASEPEAEAKTGQEPEESDVRIYRIGKAGAPFAFTPPRGQEQPGTSRSHFS